MQVSRKRQNIIKFFNGIKYFMLLIFLPQIIQCFLLDGGKNAFKFQHSSIQKIQMVLITPRINLFSTLEFADFFGNNTTKFDSSIINFFSPVSAYCEEIPEQNTNKEGNYPNSRMRKDIDKQIVQCFFAFILVISGFLIIGFVINLLIQKIYYYFTQQQG